MDRFRIGGGTLEWIFTGERAFRQSPEAWAAIDCAATHMYDYQNHFSDPDSFDRFLAEWRQVTGDKEFLSAELCVDNSRHQVSSYRLALVMGELYHTNLTVAGASAILYCWLLCNVERPSYGWTRTLFVADPVRGFVPVPSGCQLRGLGAFSRLVREVTAPPRFRSNRVLL